MHLSITVDCDAMVSAAVERHALPFALPPRTLNRAPPVPLATFVAHLVAMHAGAATPGHAGTSSDAYLPPARASTPRLNHLA